MMAVDLKKLVLVGFVWAVFNIEDVSLEKDGVQEVLEAVKKFCGDSSSHLENIDNVVANLDVFMDSAIAEMEKNFDDLRSYREASFENADLMMRQIKNGELETSDQIHSLASLEGFIEANQKYPGFYEEHLLRFQERRLTWQHLVSEIEPWLNIGCLKDTAGRIVSNIQKIIAKTIFLEQINADFVKERNEGIQSMRAIIVRMQGLIFKDEL